MSEPADRPTFLSVVPPAFAESRPPLVYHVLRAALPGVKTPHRYASSEAYRAEAYACGPFHRPLSKLLRAE